MNDTITVDDVLKLYPKLGVPHFQRGLVWGEDSVAALLESLFFDTPCGSFVFWKTGDSRTHGVPMLNNSTGHVEHLVVDGQQRIRSLWQIFDCARAGNKEFWCINLTQLPKFKDILQPHTRDYSLFVRTSWPKEAKSKSPFKYNVLPLQLLRAGARDGFEQYMQFRPGKRADDLKGLMEDLCKDVAAINSRQFFRTVKHGSPAEMINLYNRINSGGKRVEAEEIAFARLIALYPQSYHHIAKIFEEVHRNDDDEAPPSKANLSCPSVDHLSRDDVMTRQKENRFGFKLFIRTFIQVSNYHLCRSAGSQALSFNVVHADSFAREIAEGSEKGEFLWAETHAVLVAVRQLLRKELHYDALAFLPDASSLIPVFQLLIQYPKLRESRYWPLLGWAALTLLITYDDLKDILVLVAQLRDEGEVASEILPGMLEELDAKARRRILNPKTLEDADSIQNRYVLLLYGLVRHNKARDFSWKNVPANISRQDQGSQFVHDRCKPEKQHIVPFSRLKNAIDDNKARRGSSHPFNNIGNLTYISSEQNGLVTGLEDRPIDRGYEPPENQVAHFLQGGQRLDDVGSLYDELKRILWDEEGASLEGVEAKYKRFCSARRVLIAKGFEAWLDDLKVRSLAVIAEDKAQAKAVRLKAITPRCVELKSLPLTQRIRAMDYQDNIEDALVGYVRKYEDRHDLINPRNTTGTSIELCLSEGGAVRLVMSSAGIMVVYSEWVPVESRDPVDSVLGISQTNPCLYDKKRGGTLTLPLLEKASLGSGKLDALKEQYLELARRKTPASGRSPNLSEEELKALAERHKVLPLYETALKDLRPRFNSVSRTKSSLTLCGKLEGGPEALIAICPGNSSIDQGLALVIYVDRVAQYFEIPEAMLKAFLGEPACDSETWWPERTWCFPAKRLDDFVRLLSKEGHSRGVIPR